MHGEDDRIVPIADSAPLSAKLLKKATLKTLKGLPHGMCTTNRTSSTRTCSHSSELMPVPPGIPHDRRRLLRHGERQGVTMRTSRHAPTARPAEPRIDRSRLVDSPAVLVPHVVISLFGLVSGFVLIRDFLRSRASVRPSWTFLVSTTLTSTTGYLFPATTRCPRT